RWQEPRTSPSARFASSTRPLTLGLLVRYRTNQKPICPIRCEPLNGHREYYDSTNHANECSGSKRTSKPLNFPPTCPFSNQSSPPRSVEFALAIDEQEEIPLDLVGQVRIVDLPSHVDQRRALVGTDGHDDAVGIERRPVACHVGEGLAEILPSEL